MATTSPSLLKVSRSNRSIIAFTCDVEISSIQCRSPLAIATSGAGLSKGRVHGTARRMSPQASNVILGRWFRLVQIARCLQYPRQDSSPSFVPSHESSRPHDVRLLILIGTTLQRLGKLVHVETAPKMESCFVLSGLSVAARKGAIFAGQSEPAIEPRNRGRASEC
jgi:hypothetical protein